MSEIADLIAVARTGEDDPAWKAIRALQERGEDAEFRADEWATERDRLAWQRMATNELSRS